MAFSDEALQKYTQKRFARAASYDPAWAHENEMGPNALWMKEALTALRPSTKGDQSARGIRDCRDGDLPIRDL